MTLESLEGNLKLFLDVYDEDLNNDDFIGGISIDLQQIIAKGFEEGVRNNLSRRKFEVKFEITFKI